MTARVTMWSLFAKLGSHYLLNALRYNGSRTEYGLDNINVIIDLNNAILLSNVSRVSHNA